MAVRFGRFELDERARTLRLDGAERQLQPLVFDLLVYLVARRERVVPKDELLDELWDGATVSDGSLQRAISLLRAVLREGGLEHAVQTFARRGYRFCEALEGETRAIDALDAGRLIAECRWQSAVEVFEALPDKSLLSAADWESWGSAALCAGELRRAVAPLERAVAAFEEARELEGAARAALLLTNLRLEARELAVAEGWHQRAGNYLRGLPECKQHALHEWLASRLALFQGKLEACCTLAENARQIADRVADPDLRCLGLVFQGHILIAKGEVRHGLSLHDEAGAAALAGRLSPWVGGVVFCSIIWAYLHLGDHHRAGQWTDEFTRWCERHGSYGYPAMCRLHRSEVLALRGELARAEAEVRRAREQLACSGPFCEGDACRVLGEIRLALGDLSGADSAFREAHRLGWNPQPGLSLLLAARGEADAAIKQLERALSQPSWTDGQRRGSILAVLARIAAMNGHRERAASALQELARAPQLSESHVSAAERARAEGELAWLERDLAGAESAFRRSIARWLDVSAPLNAADVRLRLGALLIRAGDAIDAEIELGSAQAVFEGVGATPLVARCRALRESMTGG